MPISAIATNLFCVWLGVTTLFLIAKIWQRGVRRDMQTCTKQKQE